MNDKITVTDYFGGCPKCGGSDGLYNVGRANWFVCHTHKVRWTVGSNILSSWRYETEDEQRERWEVVADYEDIEDGSLPEGVWSRDPVARGRSWRAPLQRGLRLPRRRTLELKIATERCVIISFERARSGLGVGPSGSSSTPQGPSKEGVTLDDGPVLSTGGGSHA
jgi:hypothetical protein